METIKTLHKQLVIGVGKIKFVKQFQDYGMKRDYMSIIVNHTGIDNNYKSANVKIYVDELKIDPFELSIGANLTYFGTLKEVVKKETDGTFKLIRTEIWASKLEIITESTSTKVKNEMFREMYESIEEL